MANYDVTQKLDILEVIYNEVILQENKEVSQKLIRYKSDNIQWVLNTLQGLLEEVRDVLEMEEMWDGN